MSKYDWTNVPDNVKWISTDWEGWKLHHTSKPIENEDLMSFDSKKTDVIGYLNCYEDSEFKGNWKESLEGRP